MQIKGMDPAVSDTEKCSVPLPEKESVEKNNGEIFGILEIRSVKSNAINKEEGGVMATNISSRSNHLMNDHPTGRLLSRTVGINKIEEKRLSTGEYLSSQRKYESGDCSTTIYDGLKGYNLDPPGLIDSDDEVESDVEAEESTENFSNEWTKPAPDITHDASEKVTLEHESGSAPSRSTSVIRRRYVQNSDSDSTTTDIE